MLLCKIPYVIKKRFSFVFDALVDHSRERFIKKVASRRDLDPQPIAQQHRVGALHVKEAGKAIKTKRLRLIKQTRPTLGCKQENRVAPSLQGLFGAPGQRRNARIESSDKHKMQVWVHVVHQNLQLEQHAKKRRALSQPLRQSAGIEYGMTVRILP